MTDGLWLSLALGGGMGLLYGIAAYASLRFASRHQGQQFYVFYFAGMMVRLMAVLVSLVLILVLMDVHDLVFVGSFMGLVFIGIAFEIMSLQRTRFVPEAKE